MNQVDVQIVEENLKKKQFKLINKGVHLWKKKTLFKIFQIDI